MNIEILSLSGDTIKFLLRGVDISFANALRRTMISEVPCMAIDDIFFFDNSSTLPDEVLAHRVGYIPLTTDLKGYVLPERCECKSELGCSKCRTVLTLDVEAENELRVVYSGDLVSEDPNVRPASPNIVLAKLAPGQSIRFEAYARLGLGKVHSKWQPASMCVYKQEEAEPGARKTAEQGDTFMFTVESTGCLTPEELVREAAMVLVAKLDEMSGKFDRGETNDEIVDFEITEEVGRGLYSVGAGDFEEEGEEGGPQE